LTNLFIKVFWLLIEWKVMKIESHLLSTVETSFCCCSIYCNFCWLEFLRWSLTVIFIMEHDFADYTKLFPCMQVYRNWKIVFSYNFDVLNSNIKTFWLLFKCKLFIMVSLCIALWKWNHDCYVPRKFVGELSFRWMYINSWKRVTSHKFDVLNLMRNSILLA